MSKELKYHLLTWGGFYNESYTHNYKPGDYVFDTIEEREQYISLLETVSEKLNAKVLMIRRTEGFNCDVRTICHRVTKYKDKLYKSERDLGVNYDYFSAEYMLTDKWTLGFNDYPLGENFDYDNGEAIVVSEWITGAFSLKD